MSLDNELHEAASNGDVTRIKNLISRGANVDAPGLNGMSPLFQAVGSGYLNAVEALVAEGADVHYRPANGKTALDMAIAFREASIARFLDSKGCARTMQAPWDFRL